MQHARAALLRTVPPDALGPALGLAPGRDQALRAPLPGLGILRGRGDHLLHRRERIQGLRAIELHRRQDQLDIGAVRQVARCGQQLLLGQCEVRLRFGDPPQAGQQMGPHLPRDATAFARVCVDRRGVDRLGANQVARALQPVGRRVAQPRIGRAVLQPLQQRGHALRLAERLGGLCQPLPCSRMKRVLGDPGRQARERLRSLAGRQQHHRKLLQHPGIRWRLPGGRAQRLRRVLRRARGTQGLSQGQPARQQGRVQLHRPAETPDRLVVAQQLRQRRAEIEMERGGLRPGRDRTLPRFHHRADAPEPPQGARPQLQQRRVVRRIREAQFGRP
jgi:hypothetical protein